MTCDHARCAEDATTALRMGDGHYNSRTGKRGHPPRHKQTYCRYCPAHLAEVKRLFHTCDETPVAVLERTAAGGGLKMRR